jgi:hypothetical protein
MLSRGSEYLLVGSVSLKPGPARATLSDQMELFDRIKLLADALDAFKVARIEAAIIENY